VIYFDTCALLKLVRSDGESAGLGAFIDARPGMRWLSSELAVAELGRTVRRLNHDDQGRLVSAPRLRAELEHASLLCAQLDLIAVSSRVLTAAAAIEQPFLRTLDAIHVASAAAMLSALSAFVTYDKRLAAVAHEAGLPVLCPGPA
jgi:predicted nucleic acid-binding protein